MCFGSKSAPATQAIPPPNPPTTFDYSAANRAQSDADTAARRAQSGTVLSQTGAFGSELGGNTTLNQPNPQAP